MSPRQIRHRRFKRCAFCPNPADSKEHAWESWALERLHLGDSVIHGYIENEEFFDAEQRAVRIKCLCVPCNTGWLKRVVDASIPLVGSMMNDLTIPLDPAQQWTVAVWAMTRAMVWEHISKDPRPIFYTDHQRFTLRETQSIPPNTTIWLARYSGSEHLGTWVNDFINPVRGRTTTLVYRYLAVQVLSVRPDKSVQPGTVIHPKRRRLWSPATVRIWPSQRIAYWPPRLTVDRVAPWLDFLSRWDADASDELIPL
jgi:hypothetical protein